MLASAYCFRSAFLVSFHDAQSFQSAQPFGSPPVGPVYPAFVPSQRAPAPTPFNHSPQSLMARENSPAVVTPNVDQDSFIAADHTLHGF